MKSKLKTYATDMVIYLLILLFVYAAINKLSDFEKFKIQLGKSPVITAYANIVAIITPLTEISLSILLLFRRTSLLALYGSFCLMVMFSAYIIIILNFSPYVPCSCGGVLEHMNWKQHLIFNLFFVALSASGVMLYPQEQKSISRIEGQAENLK